MLHDRVDDAFLDAAGPRLRVVANVAVGYDNIDVAACTARGVRVTNTPGVLTDATADIAMALILMATRRLGEGERLIRAQVPGAGSMHYLLGTRPAGQDARHRRARPDRQPPPARRARAFGMDDHLQRPPARRPGGRARSSSAHFVDLDELLATTDVVSLHCPLTPATRHLINGRAPAQMKPTPTSSTPRAARSSTRRRWPRRSRDGVIAGAGLDVFEHEPEVHPDLLELDNVVLLPHLGSATIETRTAMAELAARNAIGRARRQRPADARRTDGRAGDDVRAGGEAAGMRRLTDAFYGLVFADDLLAPLFHDRGDQHADRLAMWLTELFGGPAEHTEHRGGFEVMKGAHQNLQITEPQRARWAELMYRGEHRGRAAGGVPAPAAALHRGRDDLRDADQLAGRSTLAALTPRPRTRGRRAPGARSASSKPTASSTMPKT